MRQLQSTLEKQREGGFVVFVPSLPGCVSQGETDREALEDDTDRTLHSQIRILREAVPTPYIACRRCETQFTALGQAVLRTPEPQREPMQFGFRHRALEVQEQSVVAALRVVGHLLVDDHDLRDCAKGKQSLPVLGTARQAPGLALMIPFWTIPHAAI